MQRTTIEWTDYTWNPVTGCNKVSRGCRNCYAETMANRFWGDRKFTDVVYHEDRLAEPDKNKKKWAGKKVFVCSMSDLFHESVSEYFIHDVFETIHNYPDTVFQILTKRPHRAAATIISLPYTRAIELPKNIWLGVSCENQTEADNRIPLLLQIPAAVRFLSCEPLVGPIDLDNYLPIMEPGGAHVDWVIAGGESGYHAQPMHPEWVRSLRDQCASAGVPFFFKQWGEWLPNGQRAAASYGPYVGDPMEYYPDMDGYYRDLKKWLEWCKKNTHHWPNDGNNYSHHVGKSKAGNFLDGKQHLEFPHTQLAASSSQPAANSAHSFTEGSDL